jgi:hypothetical protein
MISPKKCECKIVAPHDILTTRCIGGKPKHRTCGGVIVNESRILIDDRPRIERR